MSEHFEALFAIEEVLIFPGGIFFTLSGRSRSSKNSLFFFRVTVTSL
jgi:hypothetical protein